MSDAGIILLVEDRPDDVELVRKAFVKAGITTPLKVVSDGEEAIAYLSGIGLYSNRDEYPLPELILLDLKMPKVDGFETLKWLRAQEGFHTIPVIVLTSSEQVRDVNRAYELGANSFLVKPFDFTNLVALTETLKAYWFHLNKGPQTARVSRKPNGRA
jgi:CheY-like chemotaxis protein